MFLGSSLISCTTKKQQNVSHSSTKSKYRALSQVCVQMVWISHLFSHIRLLLHRPITLYCDNLCTTYMASNSIVHAWTRHIERDYQCVMNGLSRNLTEFVLFSRSMRLIYSPNGCTSYDFRFHGPNLCCHD